MDKKPALTLRLIRDDEWTGQLFAEVDYLGFSGHSSAWLSLEEVANFSKSLRASFPFAPDALLKLEGGYLKKTEPVIDQLHLGLAFYPIGGCGIIGCHVQLRNLYVRTTRDFFLDIEIRTSYEEIKNFSFAIEKMVADDTKTAGLISIV